jgi:hypothetical protein
MPRRGRRGTNQKRGKAQATREVPDRTAPLVITAEITQISLPTQPDLPSSTESPTLPEVSEAQSAGFVWPEALRSRSFMFKLCVVLAASFILIYFVDLFFGALATGFVLTILSGGVSLWVSSIEKSLGSKYNLALPWSPQSWLGVAFLSIILFQVIELLIRFWLLPMRLIYGSGFSASPIIIIGTVMLDWLGFVLCGWLIGRLMPTKAVTAATIGASLFLCLNLSEAYIGVGTYPNYTYMATLAGLGTDEVSAETFRLGVVVGLVCRVGLAVLVARLVARHRIRRGLVYR